MFTKLRALMTRFGAGSKPIWDTESAWWSTGDYNLYAGAARTAESLILARTLGVRMAAHEIEGGWQDWSLIDPRFGVKPAALAGITTKVMLGDRRFLGFANSGMPHTTVARFDGVTVVWSDRLSVRAAVSGASAAYDVLGRPLPGAGSIVITGAPTYLIGNATVRAAAPGTNVARGARVQASSGTGAAGVVDGRTDNADRGDTTSAWVASSNDARPTLLVTLARAARVHSILVATPSSGSIVPGLRDYTVSLRDAKGKWHDVATKRDQVWDRMALLTVKPQVATAVRLTAQAVNDSGIRQCWPGEGVQVLAKARAQAVVQELEVYGVPVPAAAKRK
jgi:hypothetical protein